MKHKNLMIQHLSFIIPDADSLSLKAPRPVFTANLPMDKDY